jgi:hypothetical protein
MQCIFLAMLLPVLILSLAGPANCAVMGPGPASSSKAVPRSPANVPLPTVARQIKLLTAINRAFVDGYLSIRQAKYLRQDVDALAEKEELYLAQGNPTSEAFISHENGALSDIQVILDHCMQLAWEHHFKGTAELQEQVLATIDMCLGQGKIPPQQAENFKAKVNRICAEEAWHLSNDEPTIPEVMIDQDTKELTALDGQLKKNLIGSKTNTAL